MTKKISNVAPVIVALVATVGSIPNVSAGNDSAQLPGTTASLFEACKGIAIVDSESYEKNKGKMEQFRKDCGADSVQVMPKTGFWTDRVNNAPDASLTGAVSTLAFLESVGEKKKDILSKNLVLFRAAELCASGSESDAAKALAEARKTFPKDAASCDSLLSGSKKQLEAILPQARAEMILAKDPSFLRDNMIKAVGGDLDALLVKQPGGKESSGGVFKVEMDGATDSELATARKQVAKFMKTTLSSWGEAKMAKQKFVKSGGSEAEWEKKGLNDFVSSRRKDAQDYLKMEYTKFQNEHVGRYQSILGKSKLLAVIGHANATNSELATGFKKLREATEKELAKNDELLSKTHILNFSKDEKSQAKARDLMALMGDLSVVEAVLEKDRKSCGTAMGVMNYLSSAEMRKSVGEMALFAVPFAATERLAALAARGGVALSSAQMGALMGSAMGVGFTGYGLYDAQKKVNEAEQGFIAGTKKIEQVNDARKETLTELVASPMNFIGTKGGAVAGATLAGAVLGKISEKVAASAVERSLVKAGVKGAESEALLKAARSGDKAAQTKVSKAVDESVKEVFGNANPTEEEVAMAAQASKLAGNDVESVREVLNMTRGNTEAKEAFAQLVERANKSGKKLDEKTSRQMLKDVTIISRYGKTADADRIVAIYTDPKWDGAAREGFSAIVSDMKRISEEAKFKKLPLKERREAAFDEALKRRGMMNAEERQAARECTLGDAKAFRSASLTNEEFQKLDQNAVKVCVQSEDKVFFRYVN